ncbi:ABC transporter permease [Nonomuraea sp. NEAU-A123]|uniref:ABC transporter permease n=1 Tax=Nonomuraea sp. NEAU-A123 TaxID=2839649 RepID=UPI001BE3FED8|nr:ABC transporter permease [Nonomuraea sp. NEAU-A123]MBT2231527.1 ABC transporter permease [Nonomuraea sp. NEAU-A123]
MTVETIAEPQRVGLLAAIKHSGTLTWRNLLKVRNSPEQLVDVIIQPIVFVIIFAFLFGGAISGDWRAYLQFLVPGLMVQTVLFATMGIGVALNADANKGIVDRFRSLPIARWAPLAGAVFGDAGRYVISMVALVGFGSILGFRFQNGLLAGLAACLVTLGFALALCCIPATVGLTVKNPQTVQGIGFIVMFPLTIISNVLVKTETLPTWLQAWVKVSPVTQVVNATRGLMLGGPVAEPVLYTALWGVGIVIVFAPLAVRAYFRRT